MITIRNPIHIQTNDEVKSSLDRIQDFLSADAVIPCQPGIKIDDIFLVGPRHNQTITTVLKQLGCPKKENISADTNILAWGVWMPRSSKQLDAPVVQIFRLVAGLGDRPVLISDNQLEPGELIVVTEDCHSFVTLRPYQGEDLPPDIQWFAWVGNRQNPLQEKSTPSVTKSRIAEPLTSSVNPGPVISASSPWLTDSSPNVQFNLTPETPSFQLTPMLPPEEFEALAKAMTLAPWTRRIGDIYSQDSLDIAVWSQTCGCPEIVKTLMQRLQKPEMVEQITRLTGVSVTAQREIFSYRLREGERILNHADGTCNGQLIVRINWLLQVPGSPLRKWDFRFWHPDRPEKPPIVYPSLPNQAVIFLMGKDTPHDITPIPKNSGVRTNIIMTFGHRK
ncbi:hypothetical protein B9T07_20225 [Limnospira fusiformis CCALA 023]